VVPNILQTHTNLPLKVPPEEATTDPLHHKANTDMADLLHRATDMVHNNPCTFNNNDLKTLEQTWDVSPGNFSVIWIRLIAFSLAACCACCALEECLF
jgi:hypothetical protein